VKREQLALLGVLAVIAAVIATDILLVRKYEARFKEIEKQRIVTSNKLATAKIVSENLNHVRDLVFKNMDLPGMKPTQTQETSFFSFVTTCVNDLKLKLISVKPIPPVTQGRVTTYAYDIEVEGDFFKLGELCAKFENSRRITTIDRFAVSLRDGVPNSQDSETRGPLRPAMAPVGKIGVTMRVNTYWVR